MSFSLHNLFTKSLFTFKNAVLSSVAFGNCSVRLSVTSSIVFMRSNSWFTLSCLMLLSVESPAFNARHVWRHKSPCDRKRLWTLLPPGWHSVSGHWKKISHKLEWRLFKFRCAAWSIGLSGDLGGPWLSRTGWGNKSWNLFLASILISYLTLP